MKLTRESLDDIRKILREASNDSPHAEIAEAIFFLHESEPLKNNYPREVSVALSVKITGRVKTTESLLAEQKKICQLWNIKLKNLN